MSRSILAFTLPLLLALPASADQAPADAGSTLEACRAQIVARDAPALAKTVAEVRSWGEIEDPALRAGAEFCLEIAAAQLGDTPTPGTELASTSAPAAEPTPEPVDPRLRKYLDQVSVEGADMTELAERIAGDTDFNPAPGEARDKLEAALLAHAKPIPAAQAAANRVAYAALARVDPENQVYADKVKHYTGALHATGKRVLKSLRKTTAAYDGSSWSRHPSSPRYQDIRDYVTLYLLDDGKGNKSMEFFLNYTSRDGWLFVQSANLNLDGEEVRVPTGRWSRDNDTEIWEWGGFEGPKAIELAERVINARRAVVRFYGQEFYSDHVITATEKRVMREMLAAWRYLEELD